MKREDVKREDVKRDAHMKRADLHIHTIASGDSSLQPEDVVRQAVAAGLSAIAFTDHDGTGANDVGRRLAAQYGIEFVAGVEVSSSWRGELAHVLGYFPHGAGPSLRQFVIDAVWRTTRRTALTILERLRPLGFDISVEDYDAKAAEMGYQGSSLYQLAYERGYVSDVGAYQARVAALHIESVRCGYPPVPEVMAAVHDAGGMAVLAHPYAAPEFHEFDEDDIETLAGQGLAAIEVFHPRHMEEGVMGRYAALCDRLGLLQTGGSDSHGKAAPPNRRYVGGMTCDWAVVRRRLGALA